MTVAMLASPLRRCATRRQARTGAGVFLLVLALLSGCASPGVYDPARVGPFYVPENVAAEPNLAGVRRVVLLPAWTPVESNRDSVADLDPVFLSALQEQNRFEIVPYSRAAFFRRFGRTALSSAAALPHDFLAHLKREYAADAVMFVDVTVYRPYRPQTLGLRAKLASIDGLRLVWTFDNVFSADQAPVANAARHFQLKAESSVPADLTDAILLSPSRYAAYAASTMFATLPPVR